MSKTGKNMLTHDVTFSVRVSSEEKVIVGRFGVHRRETILLVGKTVDAIS
jgi:hypothetical protein